MACCLELAAPLRGASTNLRHMDCAYTVYKLAKSWLPAVKLPYRKFDSTIIEMSIRLRGRPINGKQPPDRHGGPGAVACGVYRVPGRSLHLIKLPEGSNLPRVPHLDYADVR